MIQNETLIRLRDCEAENSFIASFYTEKPSEFLNFYLLCQKAELPLNFGDNNEKGDITEIEVGFGGVLMHSKFGDERLPYIDVWIKKW